MRILVMSECHGSIGKVIKAIENQPEAKDIFYLGDGVNEVESIIHNYPDRSFHLVHGNCDWNSMLPTTASKTLSGTTVFYTHGHTLFVKRNTDMLLAAAKQAGAKIALFGHTHCASIEYKDGIHLVNPGALSASRNGPESYAVIDILPNGIMPIIIKI